MTDKEKRRNKVIRQMKALGTYQPGYADIINVYVDLMLQYDALQSQYEASGYQVTEEYTNKAGATNQRKVPILNALETLRKDIATYSDRLQLNPKANKQEVVADKKDSGNSFDSLISQLGKESGN
ncbi:P27 family phage terminase small subunit [Holzapfeliella sp. He02]|uniref:P27 family phage terminase small subunit n=1 Tax=Holzapfeliella saturejae TaxID=3082953 RepID=A0ABU8SJ37_9LACO